MAPMAAMVLSDLTHWILHEICSSDGPWAGTYFYVLIEPWATTHWLFSLVIFSLQIDERSNNVMAEYPL